MNNKRLKFKMGSECKLHKLKETIFKTDSGYNTHIERIERKDKKDLSEKYVNYGKSISTTC